MTTTERQTLDAMQKYGGSFVKALSYLYIAADPANRLEIRSTWPVLWAKYEGYGRDQAKAREAGQ